MITNPRFGCRVAAAWFCSLFLKIIYQCGDITAFRNKIFHYLRYLYFIILIHYVMIESSFMCPSAWDPDIIQDFNGCVPDIPSLFDFNEFTDSGDVSPYSNELSSSSDDLFLSELNLDVTEEFVTEILQESCAGFSDLDWLSIRDSPKKTTKLKNSSSPVSRKSRHKEPTEHLDCSKLWSEMCETEQLETLHALSEIVTFHMGIREQMEVIQIIDPTAIISPDDKEFVLDSAYMDDFKLQRIKDYLRKQFEFKNVPKSTHTYSSIKSSRRIDSSSKLLSRRSSSKKKKEDTSLPPSEDKQLKLKRQKQTRKEQKSGFFVYEKKMKLENPQEDDEDDINILE